MHHAILFYGFDVDEKERHLQKIRAEIQPRFEHAYGREEYIGIADVRGIGREALLSPGEFSQLFVLYNADRMTREASHALLKILEEPPRGSMFVLCAESRNGILPTLLSRLEHVACVGTPGHKKVLDPATIKERDEAIQFFMSEISRVKKNMEDHIRNNQKHIEELRCLQNSIRMLMVLLTSPIAPRYAIESYMLCRVS